MTNLHEAVPEEAGEHIGSFVDALVMQGLATYPDPGCYRETDSQSDFPALDGRKRLPYEPPNLIDLSSGKAARGDCGGHGSQPGDCYMNGNGALGCCNSGGCPLTPDTPPCCPGTCGATSCGDGNYACEHGWGCTGGAHNDGNCGLGNSAQYVCGTGSSPGNTCQEIFLLQQHRT
jgi:hypothetical protein